MSSFIIENMTSGDFRYFRILFMSIYQIPYNHKSMQIEAPDHDYYPTVVTSILLHSPKLYCGSGTFPE
jgi:hypothetical protein